MRIGWLGLGILASSLGGCFPFDGDSGSGDGPVFTVDGNTVAYYRFDEGGDSLANEAGSGKGALVGATKAAGYRGKGVQCGNGKYARLDFVLPDRAKSGTIEIYARFAHPAADTSVYSLVGTQGARCNLFYSNGYLFFMKNHANLPKSTKGEFVPVKDVWYKLAATWGPKGMRLFVNDRPLAASADTTVYRMDDVPGSPNNVFFLGLKNRLGLEDTRLESFATSYYFDGTLDELRVSDIERY